MTQTVGGQPVSPTSSATGGGIASRIAGQAIRGVASRLITVSSAVVRSNYALPKETLIALDTAPSVSVTGRSVAGRIAEGTRVAVLLYPPRGILILGSLDDEVPEDDPEMIVYDTSGTLTAAQVGDARAIRVRVWGGGGSGAGAIATGVGESSCGGGGQAGGYAESIILVSALTLPETVTVGAAGVIGAAGTAGTGGGTSALDAHVSAAGGAPGGISASSSVLGLVAVGGSGAQVLVGQHTARGSDGGPGDRVGATFCTGMIGGASPGGGGTTRTGNSVNATGLTGSTPGGGGSGARNSASQAARVGSAGAPGRVIIELLP